MKNFKLKFANYNTKLINESMKFVSKQIKTQIHTKK